MPFSLIIIPYQFFVATIIIIIGGCHTKYQFFYCVSDLQFQPPMIMSKVQVSAKRTPRPPSRQAMGLCIIMCKMFDHHLAKSNGCTVAVCTKCFCSLSQKYPSWETPFMTESGVKKTKTGVSQGRLFNNSVSSFCICIWWVHQRAFIFIIQTSKNCVLSHKWYMHYQPTLSHTSF